MLGSAGYAGDGGNAVIETPCRYCVPPVRHPGCLCDAKKAWDEQRRQAREKKKQDTDYNGYHICSVRTVKKRANLLK